MMIIYSKEMEELEKQFAPYEVPGGFDLKPGTPDSIKEAKKRFLKLFREECDRVSKMYCE